HGGVFAPGIQLDWPLEPLEALARWPAEASVAMLHSGRHHPRWSRFTILAAPVATYRFDTEQPDAGRGSLHIAEPRHPSAAMLRELARCVSARPLHDCLRRY